MMKSLNVIKTLKVEINAFNQGTATHEEQRTRVYSLVEEHIAKPNACFSCSQELLKGLLLFLRSTTQILAEEYKKKDLVQILYR
mmetsp:Transcript_21654/g.15910  ORF Transcript_21654/g.15910 Transcript_21654/m.15910 type:complete len:84 (+) Transcript_21654:649-900(+)